MKRVLFYIFLLGVALCALGCKEGVPPNGTVCPPPLYPPVSLIETVYYGEKLAPGVGYYSLTFTCGDDKLRLDLFGSVALNPDNPRLTGCTYHLGSIDEPKSKTYFVAESTDSEIGTLFWNNGTPVPVTGGEVRISLDVSTYSIEIDLRTEETLIEWKYRGVVRFGPICIYPPSPSLADSVGFQYYGVYNLSPTPLGKVILGLESSGTGYGIRLTMTVPLPDDPERVTLPTGTFHVVENPREPYRIVAENIYGDYIQYSYEYKRTVADYFEVLTIIDSGSLTIAGQEGEYTITADCGGGMVDPYNWKITGRDTVLYRMVSDQLPAYAADMSAPGSNLEDEVALVDIPNVYIDGLRMQDMVLWRFGGYTDGIKICPAEDYGDTGSLNVSGDGEVLMIQLMLPPDVSFPSGIYPLAAEYHSPELGFVEPGVPGIDADNLFDPFHGTWYTGMEGGEVRQYAGAVAGRGNVTFSTVEDGKVLRIEVEMYDKYGRRVSGTLNYLLPEEDRD